MHDPQLVERLADTISPIARSTGYTIGVIMSTTITVVVVLLCVAAVRWAWGVAFSV